MFALNVVDSDVYRQQIIRFYFSLFFFFFDA